MENTTNASQEALYEQAKEQDIKGRSSMDKDELRAAIDQSGNQTKAKANRQAKRTGSGSARKQTRRTNPRAAPGQSKQANGQSESERVRRQPHPEKTASRVDAFDRLANAAAGGEFVMSPRHLTGCDRRRYVRECLREDHQTRIARHSEDARIKFDKLEGSCFSFFRGTALLFYRDMAGEDAWMPTVLTLGDVHPENFGVMPNADNVPFFSVNDFDEAYYAPFTWDIKRGAVGFMIAAEEEGDQGRKQQRKIVRHFVQAYIDGIRKFANEGTEQDDEWRLDSAPEMIRELLKDANKKRAKWLKKDYLNETKSGFKSNKKLVPISTRRDEFQTLVDQLVKTNKIDVPARAGRMRVKDVAIRRGQGTASLGLHRYYVLIEGPQADGSDDVIIEFKQARRSALTGLVPPSPYERSARGDRIAHAQAVHVARGDVFYGSVVFDGVSFMSRERSPFKEDIDLDDLSKSEWREYADICGWALAHVHALSDEAGDIDYDVEPAIVDAVGSPALFVDDIVNFAEEAADRVRGDHRMFKKDHALGAFSLQDTMYQ